MILEFSFSQKAHQCTQCKKEKLNRTNRNLQLIFFQTDFQSTWRYWCSCIAFPFLAQLTTIDQLIQFLPCKSQNTERNENCLLFCHFMTEVGLQLFWYVKIWRVGVLANGEWLIVILILWCYYQNMIIQSFG